MSDEIKKYGLSYVKEISFDTSIRDFSEPAKELARLDFDILFMPMSVSSVALAAPALAASGIWPDGTVLQEKKDNIHIVKYLLPSIAYSDSLLKRAGRYLQGAVFSDGFKYSNTRESGLFNDSFFGEYGQNPTTYAAYGYDAVQLISMAILKGGVKNRIELRNWIGGLNFKNGPSQDFVFRFMGMDSDGNAQMILPAVVIKENSLVLIQ
jgi:ABC-type branched-subunit amino acid transport system substrate-binding protein